MKKFTAFLLGIVMLFSLAACGGKDGGDSQQPQKEAPDLNQYYEDFMATLGEDNTPAMMDLEGEFLDNLYPGLSALETKQLVIKTAMISSVPCEFALVEVANAADAQAVADIFQARIDYQIETGALYPMTIEGWQKAQIITHDNVVALICANEEQSNAADAFEQLFA